VLAFPQAASSSGIGRSPHDLVERVGDGELTGISLTWREIRGEMGRGLVCHHRNPWMVCILLISILIGKSSWIGGGRLQIDLLWGVKHLLKVGKTGRRRDGRGSLERRLLEVKMLVQIAGAVVRSGRIP
jgi:hypothetical protein